MTALSTIILCGHQYVDTFFLHPPPTTNVLICFSHGVNMFMSAFCTDHMIWYVKIFSSHVHDEKCGGGGGVNSQDPSVEIQNVIFLCSVQTVDIIQGTFSRQYRQHLWLSSVL